MTYLNLSKTLNTQILDNLNSKTMETIKIREISPILSLSLQELNTLKLAISKNFLVVGEKGIVIEDFRTKWFDIYQHFIKYLVNNHEEIVKEVRITWANEKEMTYGRIAEILIDKRIEWIEANSEDEPKKDEPKKEPDACKQEPEPDICKSESEDFMFTSKELKHAIAMAKGLPHFSIEHIYDYQVYLKKGV
jgi:hypothetical protein